jgi:YD repeat-containing protein
MTAMHVLSPVIEEKIFNNSKYIGGTLTKYKIAVQGSQTIYVPDKKYFSSLSAPLSTAPATFSSSGENTTVYPSANIKYENQTAYGKPQSITYNDAERIIYLWSYNYQYPIAEIRNATYAEVVAKIAESTLTSIAGKAEPAAADLATVNALRTSLPNALVTTYTYRPLVGMLTATDPAGLTATYEYDSFGRLIKARNSEGKVIQSYNYHYQNQ